MSTDNSRLALRILRALLICAAVGALLLIIFGCRTSLDIPRNWPFSPKNGCPERSPDMADFSQEPASQPFVKLEDLATRPDLKLPISPGAASRPGDSDDQ